MKIEVILVKLSAWNASIGIQQTDIDLSHEYPANPLSVVLLADAIKGCLDEETTSSSQNAQRL